MELPSKSDNIETWIKVFSDSTDSIFNNMSLDDRISKAIEAYYDAQRNEEVPLMVPKNANIKPRLNIIKIVGDDIRPGSVSLMGNNDVKEETLPIKENLNIKRVKAIIQLALPENTKDELIESYINYAYDETKPFSSSIQDITDSFNQFTKSLSN